MCKKETEETTLDILQTMHANLRKYRYFYYECNDIIKVDGNIISDYEYDILEKRYDVLCNELGIIKELRMSERVGWDVMIPMDLNNFYEYDDVLRKCILK